MNITFVGGGIIADAGPDPDFQVDPGRALLMSYSTCNFQTRQHTFYTISRQEMLDQEAALHRDMLLTMCIFRFRAQDFDVPQVTNPKPTNLQT